MAQVPKKVKQVVEDALKPRISQYILSETVPI